MATLASRATPSGTVDIYSISDRIKRLELATDAILKRLLMPALDTFDITQKAAEPATSAAPLDPAELPDYEYKQLDISKSEIRILQLKPDPTNPDGPLIGSLIPVSLDVAKHAISAATVEGMARRTFSALSYTWGPPVFDGSIIIDGKVLRITSALERALRQIRKTKDAKALSSSSVPNSAALMQRVQIQSAYWWIDAVCINQKDVEERNAQVALMRRIYHSAPRVIVWLGDEADDSKLAMQTASEIAAIPLRGPGAKVDEYPTLSDDEKIRKWKALAALFRRPWWERAWIRQEIALTSAPEVFCGDVSTTWRAITNIGNILSKLSPYMKQSPNNPAIPLTARDANARHAGWGQTWFTAAEPLDKLNSDSHRGIMFLDLVELLYHARSCKATDDRDKVYAVLGLADPDVYKITADYRLASKDIYISTTRAIIERTKRVHILGLCQNLQRAHGLPSWVPDLTSPWKSRPFPIDRDYVDAETSFNADGRVLLVKGYTYGTISHLCPAIVTADAAPEQLQNVYTTWKKYLADELAVFKKDRVYGQNRQYLEALDGSQLYHDRPWLDFLSINTIPSRDLAYEKAPSGEPVADSLVDRAGSASGMGGLNLKHIHSLLMPACLETEAHRYGRLHTALREFGLGRRFGIVDPGSLALLPGEVRVGDALVCFDGGKYPYLLRRVGGEGDAVGTEAEDGEEKWVLVGEAYIYQGNYGSKSKRFYSIV